MKNNGKVQGSQNSVEPIEILGNRVLVRSNIASISSDSFIGWEYDEIEYDLREYLQLTSNKVETLEKDKAELQNQVTQNQVAMAELFETVATLQGATNA